MTQQDLDLERRIDAAALALAGAPTASARRQAWEELQELRARRRPERVEEMEREQGLC